MFLVIIDFCLLLLGFMAMDLPTSILALLLAFLIHRCGLETLFGPSRGENIKLHDKVKITPEQRKEIVETLRAERMEKRQERQRARRCASKRCGRSVRSESQQVE